MGGDRSTGAFALEDARLADVLRSGGIGLLARLQDGEQRQRSAGPVDSACQSHERS